MKRIHVLVGEKPSALLEQHVARLGWGHMILFQDPTRYTREGEKWGFDNGAFIQWRRGEAFDEFGYMKRLERVLACPNPPFMAIAPDIVGGGLHSLDFSLKWLERLPQILPWYLAVQDGMEVADVRPILTPFAGVFLGGLNGFKATAGRWRKLAREQDKQFHYGRAGTPAKLRSAIRVGADSADSAFPLWSLERLLAFERFWLNAYDQQELLPCR